MQILILRFPDSEHITAVKNIAEIYKLEDVTEEITERIEKLPECSCKGYIERSKVLEIIGGAYDESGSN